MTAMCYNCLGDNMWGIYKALYIYCGYSIEMNVEHENDLIYALNMLVAMMILCVVDTLILCIAFRVTGCLRDIGYIDSFEMKKTHWGIRFALTAIILGLSFTPVFHIFRPIINIGSMYLMGILCTLYNYAIDTITSATMDAVNLFIR